jgi:hypothetical protein
MADIGEFIGTLRINFEGQGVKDASASMADAQKQGNLLNDVSNRLVVTMGDLYGAGMKVANFMWSFVQAAAESELAEKKLSDAMKVQQVYSSEAYEANIKYAESMQQVTKYDKEEILAVMQKLTTFGLHDEQLRKTSTATMDLAARGYDLNAVSMLLGKAFEGNTTALKRFGIVIDDNIPSGQKFDAVLANIQQHMGGLALGEAQTLNGKLAIMKNNINELKETIGNLLLPVVGYWADKMSEVARFVDELRGAEIREAQVAATTAQQKLQLMETDKVALNGRMAQLKQYQAEGSFVNKEEIRQIEAKLALITKSETFIRQQAVAELSTRQQVTDKKKVLSLSEQQMAEATAKATWVANKKATEAIIKDDMRRLASAQKKSEEEQKANAELNVKLMAEDATRYAYTIDQQITLLKQFQDDCDIKSKAYQVYQLRIMMLDKEKYQNAWKLEQQLEGDFAGGIKSMLDGSRSFSEAVGDIWNNITNQILGYIAQIIAKWLILNALTGGSMSFMGAAKSVLGFDEGGVVPGPIGAPRLIVAHGGETISPTHKTAFSSTNTNSKASVQEGDVTIHVNGSVDKDNIDDICLKLANAVKSKKIAAMRMTKVINKEGSFRTSEAF